MKKYFYTNDTEPLGPFTLEELKGKNINKDTLVWYQGLKDWQEASTLPELDGLFESVPPKITVPEKKETPQTKEKQEVPLVKQPPKTWLVESILTTFFCCLPLGVVAIIFASRVESRFYAGDIEGANRASAEAKKWTLWSLGLSIGFWVLYAGFLIFAAIIGILNDF